MATPWLTVIVELTLDVDVPFANSLSHPYAQIDPAILHERLISRRKADASSRIVLLRGVKQLTFSEKAGESHTVKVLVASSACDDRSAWGRLEGEGLLNEDYIMH